MRVSLPTNWIITRSDPLPSMPLVLSVMLGSYSFDKHKNCKIGVIGEHESGLQSCESASSVVIEVWITIV